MFAANGSRLYPAMPYNAYTKMSRDEVLAIRAYLNTVTPVHNAVVANTLPFPFNIRAAMRVWNALYFNKGEYKPDPQKSAEWNRGAFLVDGPASLRRLPHTKDVAGGRQNRSISARRFLAGMVRPGHHRRHSRWHGRLVGGRPRRLPEKRSQPRVGCYRADG